MTRQLFRVFKTHIYLLHTHNEFHFFFLVCLSLTWMLGSNLAKAPSMYADPSYEGYNCNKTWHPLPNYYRTDL